ncbi:MAG: ABC transporter permease [Propionibacteriaceae bacterium]
MIKYLLRRTANWLFMIFLATNLTYFLAAYYLNPRSNYAERRPPLPEDKIDKILSSLNLNDKVPVMERWWVWFKGIMTKWDWGSTPSGVADKVTDQIASRIFVSAQLLLGATVLTVLVGVSLGVYTASRQYKFADRFWQGTSILAMNIHTVVAALGVQLAAIGLNNWYKETFNSSTTLIYVTGAATDGVEGFFPILLDKAQHLILPTLSMLIVGYAGYHFTQRALLLDNIAADYVRTARAKGLTKSQAIRKHALRTSIIPIATSVAFSVPGLFTGAVLSENIYAWRGMGQYFVEALNKSDIHGVVAVSAFGALMTAIGAIASDLVLVFVDPRVRVS